MSYKESLQFEQKPMDAAAFVDRASKMAAALEDQETLSLRSRPHARQRVARTAGVPASLLHALRYRRPKTIAADAYARLCAAVEKQAITQIRILEDEISKALVCRLGADDGRVRAALALADKARKLLEEGEE